MNKSLGKHLKKIREDRGLSIREVERQTKISNAYLSQLESGQRDMPSAKILGQLAKTYGLNIMDLIFFIDPSLSDTKNQKQIQEPNAEFIVKGYSKLTDKNKHALKTYLKFLLSQESKA